MLNKWKKIGIVLLLIAVIVGGGYFVQTKYLSKEARLKSTSKNFLSTLYKGDRFKLDTYVTPELKNSEEYKFVRNDTNTNKVEDIDIKGITQPNANLAGISGTLRIQDTEEPTPFVLQLVKTEDGWKVNLFNVGIVTDAITQ